VEEVEKKEYCKNHKILEIENKTLREHKNY
jgi:uncharacterized protein YkvS